MPTASNKTDSRNICSACVMDVTAPEITFDEKGVCNFCHNAQRELKSLDYSYSALSKFIEKIKKAGEGNEYDVLIGLSGGVDSSRVLHEAVGFGLRPLCFSVDNGWNDPKADENIMRMVESLKVPFYRYVLNKHRFSELQGAFIKAGVKNIEIPTDHVLMAVTYELADQYNIKYVLSGGNVATESIMPASWGYTARDLVHIKAIYKQFTKKTLRDLPVCSLLKFNYYKWVRGIKIVYLLDCFPYNRQESIKLLEEKYEWKNYHEKHCESVFTWWFQNFYLFEKFGIDKRKAHLSSLINSGQMTRDQAMEITQSCPIYPQIGIEKNVLSYTNKEHKDYPTDEALFNFLSSVVKFLRKTHVINQ